ncbi:MAG: hypothetical protein ACK5S5_11535 [Planctomycetota bacterium]|jgi:hypothetical protein
MRTTLAICCVLVPFAATAAQTGALTAHPQETLQNSSGNFAPFGVLPGGFGAEARTMLLLPREEVPTLPAVLTAIEVDCQAGAVVDYATLEIFAAATPATGLNLAFAPNYQQAPWPALQTSNLTVNYSAGWTRIPLSNPYPFPGGQGLLIEIRKVVQPGAGGFPFATTAISSSPPRIDRAPMAYTFGSPGSGASAAAFGTAYATSIVIRLVWDGTPTIRHRSDTGASGNQYSLGGSVAVTLAAQPGQLYILAAGTSYLPFGLPLPGIGGEVRLNGLTTFASGLLGLSGADTATVSIPNDPTLVGIFLAYQGVTYDIGTQALTLTNCSDHFVNP